MAYSIKIYTLSLLVFLFLCADFLTYRPLIQSKLKFIQLSAAMFLSLPATPPHPTPLSKI